MRESDSFQIQRERERDREASAWEPPLTTGRESAQGRHPVSSRYRFSRSVRTCGALYLWFLFLYAFSTECCFDSSLKVHNLSISIDRCDLQLKSHTGGGPKNFKNINTGHPARTMRVIVIPLGYKKREQTKINMWFSARRPSQGELVEEKLQNNEREGQQDDLGEWRYNA